MLRPRAWTENQSRWAAELLPGAARRATVLELCSGAGQIGLLAVAGSERRLVCVDVNPVAAEYTRRNASAAGLREPGRDAAWAGSATCSRPASGSR